MKSIQSPVRSQFDELASNMFHALVAGLFGVVTLAAVAHVALSLA